MCTGCFKIGYFEYLRAKSWFVIDTKYIDVLYSYYRRLRSHSIFVDQLRFEIPIIAIERTASHCSETFHIVSPSPSISRLKGAQRSWSKRRRLIEVLVYFSTYVLQRPIAARRVTTRSILVILSIWKFRKSSPMKALDKSEKIRPMTREREFVSSFLVCFYIVLLGSQIPFPSSKSVPTTPYAHVNQAERSFDVCLAVIITTRGELLNPRRLTDYIPGRSTFRNASHFRSWSESRRDGCARIDVRFRSDWSIGVWGKVSRVFYLRSTLVTVRRKEPNTISCINILFTLLVSPAFL